MRTTPVIAVIPENRTKSTQHETHPIINVTGSGYGSIMFRQEVTTFEGGFLNKQSRVGHLGGRVDDLVALCEEINLKENSDFSKAVGTPYVLAVKESTKPAYEGHEPKVNPSTGETLTTPEGEYIYRDIVLSVKGSTEGQDVFIKHTKEEVVPGSEVAETEYAQEEKA